MDKQSTIGFILIGIVLVGWMWLQTPTTPPVQHRAGDTTQASRTAPLQPAAPPVAQPADTLPSPAGTGVGSESKFFAGRSSGTEKVLIVRTDLFTAELTTRGGLLRKWELTRYKTWDGKPVQLVDFDRGGDLNLLFTSSDGKLIDMRNLHFDTDRRNWETIALQGGDSAVVEMVLPIDGGGRIVKRYTFFNGSYEFRVGLRLEGAARVVSNYEYQVVWENGLRFSEANSVDEASFAKAYAFAGGEMVEIDATKTGEPVKQEVNGATSWVATHTKYFTVAMLADEGTTSGAYLEGRHEDAGNNGVTKHYSVGLKMPFKGAVAESADLRVYLGPMEFDRLKDYGRSLDRTVYLGPTWGIRQIAEYLMIPLFDLLRRVIPNYGLVIILFSLILKFALHPLTKSSMASMRKMQKLQPLLTELREKYKDDQERAGKEQMKLYAEYGINPATGCLLMIPQMIILFPLYQVFRATIELRQAPFVGWISDLSIPDTIIHLPFTIPIFGMNQISGLVIAMGVTMFLQQKMTPTDPRNKAMVWMMPVLFTLMFNGLPSGLNLYYFTFNVLSIGQQYWFNRVHKDEPLRKVDPKKGGGGFMARLAKDLPKTK
jgi:YidC/Oxa1 family membrane protein insertase